jgi:hypothetical protein
MKQLSSHLCKPERRSAESRFCTRRRGVAWDYRVQHICAATQDRKSKGEAYYKKYLANRWAGL